MHESPLVRTCLQCGQPLAADSETCANCGRDGGNPFTSPLEPVNEPKPSGVGSVLWFALIAVIAACIAIGFAAPGLGVLLGMVFVPAVVRAAAVMKRKVKVAGVQSYAGQMASAVLASAGISIAVWLASAVAFAVVCTPATFVALLIDSIDPTGMLAGTFVFGLSGLAGLASFFGYMRKFWPDVWPRVKDDDATT